MTRQQKLDAIADSLLQHDWEQYVLAPDYEQGNQVGQLAQEILDRLEPVGEFTADQSQWPAHLRDDAPFQRCSRCQRHAWSPSDWGQMCTMTQPDGLPCGGRFGRQGGGL